MSSSEIFGSCRSFKLLAKYYKLNFAKPRKVAQQVTLSSLLFCFGEHSAKSLGFEPKSLFYYLFIEWLEDGKRILTPQRILIAAVISIDSYYKYQAPMETIYLEYLVWPLTKHIVPAKTLYIEIRTWQLRKSTVYKVGKPCIMKELLFSFEHFSSPEMNRLEKFTKFGSHTNGSNWKSNLISCYKIGQFKFKVYLEDLRSSMRTSDEKYFKSIMVLQSFLVGSYKRFWICLSQLYECKIQYWMFKSAMT